MFSIRFELVLQVRRKGSSDVICRDLYWLGSEECVAGSGLDLGVAEEFADYRQPHILGGGVGGEGMAPVVDADVFDAGTLV